MNNTNAYDVLAVLIGCLTMVSLAAIGTYLVLKGHPWFGFFVLIIAGCLRIKTGNPTP